jgi:hypothetical protein
MFKARSASPARRRRLRRRWILATTMLAATAAHGADYAFWGPSAKRDKNFGLEVSSLDSVWDYDGVDVDTRIERIGIHWHETLSPRFHGGISLGWMDVTEFSNSVVEGSTNPGYFLGIDLRGLLVAQPRFQLSTRFGASYNSALGASDSELEELSWYEVELALTAQAILGEHVGLYGGGSLAAVDGRRDGDVVVSFESSTAESAFVGLDLRVDRSGHIGFQVQTGRLEGGLLYFRRWF